VEVAEYIAALLVEGERMAAAAASAGLEAKVPSCPDWVVRDLLHHQGGVHRWATGIVARPRTEPWDVDLDEVVGSWPPDDELLAWFKEGHAALVAALSQADADLACWTFLRAPSPLAMWSRRQAHETAVHRVDAELAAGGRRTRLSESFAADGIDELLSCFITRPGGPLVADPPRSLRVRCTDTAGDWPVTIGTDRVETTVGPAGTAGTAGADCEVVGRASDLYLALWSRQPAAGLGVEGDRLVLELLLDKVHVRWS
jgi:uncharacterized protein (TIGR03083 family)